MKLKPGDDLKDHLKTITEIYEELAVVGDSVEEEDRVINLLASLPDSYSTFVTALEALDDVPSWDSITERLLHQESKLQNQSGSEGGSALVSQQKKNFVC